jgi:hypothetical protein
MDESDSNLLNDFCWCAALLFACLTVGLPLASAMYFYAATFPVEYFAIPCFGPGLTMPPEVGARLFQQFFLLLVSFVLSPWLIYWLQLWVLC